MRTPAAALSSRSTPSCPRPRPYILRAGFSGGTTETRTMGFHSNAVFGFKHARLSAAVLNTAEDGTVMVNNERTTTSLTHPFTECNSELGTIFFSSILLFVLNSLSHYSV